MSDEHVSYLTPQDVADVLGVGVSTVKRLVDSRRLPARLTAGKHRRIDPSDVLRLVNSGNYPCAQPERLGQLAGLPSVDADSLCEQLYEALVAGDSCRTRSLLVSGHGGGLSVVRIADDVIAPAMSRVGHGWQTRMLDVYQEHRGTMTCLAGLEALRERIPTPGDDWPIALGGGPEGDHYLLANVLIEQLLIEQGWRAINLGPNTPLASFEKAVEHFRPRLLWISCSYLADGAAFVKGYRRLRWTAERLGVCVAVGGNALTDEVRARLTCELHGDRLEQLSAFARTID